MRSADLHSRALRAGVRETINGRKHAAFRRPSGRRILTATLKILTDFWRAFRSMSLLKINRNLSDAAQQMIKLIQPVALSDVSDRAL